MRAGALAIALALAACDTPANDITEAPSEPTPVAAAPTVEPEVNQNAELRRTLERPELGSGLMPLYRWLHANPELSNQEVKTAPLLAGMLREIGFDVEEGIGGLGVVGVLENGDGPTVLLRADMDGLPVKEETGLYFASEVTTENAAGETVPAMHACGHDVHMTSLIGAAQDLHNARDDWSGTLVVIFQPAEEIVQGARQMLDDGLFTRFPRPDYNLALHVNAALPSGQIGIVPGYALANVDTVDLSIYGVGAHGAYPHLGIDPVVISAATIMNLQTIVSRNVNPQDAAVITVGSIHGGTKHNIIGEEVKLQLTVRSYTDEVRETTISGIRRVAENTARAYGIPDDRLPQVTIRDESAPATYNDPDLAQRTLNVFADTFGKENVKVLPAVMAAEDFAEYGRTDPKIPSMIYWLGAADPDAVAAAEAGGPELPGLHSPNFAPDADVAVPLGARSLTVAALNLFNG